VLTPRQWQVLALLREGLTNDQIAARLGISVDGVKFHVSEILGKLGVSSRNEAARWSPDSRPAFTASASLRAPRRSGHGHGEWRRSASPPGRDTHRRRRSRKILEAA